MRGLSLPKLPPVVSHVALLWVVVIVSLGATIFAVIQVQNVQHHQNDAIRSIMCFAESFVEKSPRASEKQKSQAIRFYSAALSNAHLAPCSNP